LVKNNKGVNVMQTVTVETIEERIKKSGDGCRLAAEIGVFPQAIYRWKMYDVIFIDGVPYKPIRYKKRRQFSFVD
jgi:hypothetical protein